MTHWEYISYEVDMDKMEAILKDHRKKSGLLINKEDFLKEVYDITYATWHSIRKNKSIKFHTRARLEKKWFPVWDAIIN